MAAASSKPATGAGLQDAPRPLLSTPPPPTWQAIHVSPLLPNSDPTHVHTQSRRQSAGPRQLTRTEGGDPTKETVAVDNEAARDVPSVQPLHHLGQADVSLLTCAPTRRPHACTRQWLGPVVRQALARQVSRRRCELHSVAGTYSRRVHTRARTDEATATLTATPRLGRCGSRYRKSRGGRSRCARQMAAQS